MGPTGHAMKRIPRIKFPQRHPKPESSTSQPDMSSSAESLPRSLFSRSASSTSPGGKASEQPKRTPVTQDEIDAVLLGGCL
ncbi:hypothetical protein Leryth_003282 [Lithospermum erythrorhizon]|nr:hypothetical protein Leryth_003282 [Lithospermum erythrorhizon]